MTPPHSRNKALAATAMIALALAVSVTSSSSSPFDSEPLAFVDFENAFESPVQNLTIQCDSDVAKHPNVHFLRTHESFILGVNTTREHWWICTFSTKKTSGLLCREKFSGKFVVWEDNTVQPPIPHHPILCFTRCKWIVNDGGLWLRRHSHGALELVYKWPINIC